MLTDLIKGVESTLGIVSTVVGVAVVYLRLFVGNELGKLRSEFQLIARREFVTKDALDVRLASIETRILALEARPEGHPS